jgi:hypothetical protein
VGVRLGFGFGLRLLCGEVARSSGNLARSLRLYWE